MRWAGWERRFTTCRRPSTRREAPTASTITMTDIPTVTTMATDPAITMVSDAALYRLITWLSPSYPIGAYSYSHGIEAAVEAGLIHDRPSLVDWIGGIPPRCSATGPPPPLPPPPRS